jgi:hypothetical protein
LGPFAKRLGAAPRTEEAQDPAAATPSVIEFTEWATQILQRTHEAARRLNPSATVRLSRVGSGVRFSLAEEPIAALLDSEDGRTLFVQGCVRNQGKFYDRFRRGRPAQRTG